MGGLGVIGPEKFAQYFTGHPAAAQSPSAEDRLPK
jgi:hypothetical protein